ncbi:MAG: hypothetical protein HOM14_13535 [Gammaproteobacteria bacterium]|nr:hypothetical protein [Gammaproteobacteria bacterium]MBT4195399.1 hypothetical protein [Gammaproteobacteria bacterium]MBT4448091.1 hypothetical protein [Gammaproteobacteria bacterium]MBT4860407.1 hypothetical protein [Gammaproteobacteria bacterium]MBT6456036.1 hypothetical protein [Gammaproteobacteria bacterium]
MIVYVLPTICGAPSTKRRILEKTTWSPGITASLKKAASRAMTRIALTPPASDIMASAAQ